MEQQASLIATLTEEPRDGVLEALPNGVDWLEVRADLVGEIDPVALRNRFAGRLLYTLRSRSEGGGFEGSMARRRRQLAAAGQSYDRVDLEIERDLDEATLDSVAADKRLLSWHGPGCPASRLRKLFDRVRSTPAALYKFVPLARESRDEIATLDFLADLGRSDVVSFAAGMGGVWTRLVAPYLGAPVLYGALGNQAGAPGQPTVDTLCRDFGLPTLRPVESFAGIVSGKVERSLSPRLHNGLYRALGIRALYLPFQPTRFADFWLDVVEGKLWKSIHRPLRGLSVTAPFKEQAAAVAGVASPLVNACESANTLVSKEDVWQAESTDAAGVVLALQAAGVDLSSKRAAVVGSGGAGRAAAAGLSMQGCSVTLVNRTVEKARKAATLLKLDFEALEDFDPRGFDVLVNATSLGQEGDPMPFEVGDLKPGQAVLDMVYGDEPTRLVREARENGLVAIDGRHMLLHQARPQFKLMTGRELPVGLARELLEIPAEGTI